MAAASAGVGGAGHGGLYTRRFPCRGPRGAQAADPKALRGEKPFLLYPLGGGDDPEDVLTFEGVTPKPKARRGHRALRGLVTIDFFELDTREELLRGRAEQISALGIALQLAATTADPQHKALAERRIKQLKGEASPHTSCARAFHELYHSNQVRAEELVTEAINYLGTES